MIDRTTAPRVIMPHFLDLVKAKLYRLDNGLTIYYYSGCSEPVLNLNIVLKAGKYYQQKDYEAFMTAALLKKGTKTQSALEIQEALDFHGAHLGISTNLFTSSLDLSCLSEKLIDVLPIVKDILLNASFPEEELKIAKHKHIQKLKLNQEKNEYLASVKFNEFIFGANHNCGKLTSEAMISNIEKEDLVKYYHSRFLLSEQSTLILSGEIEENTLQLINKILGSIKLYDKEKIEVKPFISATEKEYIISKPESVQSSIRIGMPLSLTATDEEYLYFEILNRIFGGYFGSRLMKNIREDKGYTYGIYSFVSSFTKGSYFCIATDVGKEYQEDTLREISFEINRLKNELISEEELLMVKNYHKGRIMKSVDGSMRMANKLSTLLPLGLTEDHINRQLEVVEKITPEKIKALAIKYLDFENMYKIIVG